MTRGRKPKHPRLAQLQKKRRGSAAPEAPACPDWLCDVGRTEWQRIVTELGQVNPVTPLDLAMLAIYCDLYADMRRLREELQDEGTTVATAAEGVKANPKRKQWEWTISEMRRMASEFGFSPAARTRIDAPPEEGEEEDELTSFLGGAS